MRTTKNTSLMGENGFISSMAVLVYISRILGGNVFQADRAASQTLILLNSSRNSISRILR